MITHEENGWKMFHISTLIGFQIGNAMEKNKLLILSQQREALSYDEQIPS